MRFILYLLIMMMRGDVGVESVLDCLCSFQVVVYNRDTVFSLLCSQRSSSLPHTASVFPCLFICLLFADSIFLNMKEFLPCKKFR